MATVDVFILDSNDQTPYLYDVTNLTIPSSQKIGSIIKCFTPSDTDAITHFEFSLLVQTLSYFFICQFSF